MNKRTFIGVIVFALIEACIISCFVYFWPQGADSSEMVIDIIASTLIWSTFCIDIFHPLMDDEKHPRQAGSLGVRWTVTWVYALLAIGIMVAGRLMTWPILAIGVAQVVALVVLILGFWGASHVGDKVEAVAAHEQQKLDGRASMTNALRQLKNEIALMPQLPPYVKSKIDEFSENMRFITPNSSAEAQSLERQFVEETDNVRFALAHFEINEEAINKSLQRMMMILTDRKNILQ